MKSEQFSILFVCLGNICRSPVAKGVFSGLIEEYQLSTRFVVDSCGTGGWHAGEGAHSITQRVAKKFGVILSDHRARQITKEDLTSFDLIVAMDRSNLRDIKRLGGNSATRIICLRQHDETQDELDVPDPYDGGAEGFVEVHQIIERCCRNLLQSLRKELKL